MSTARVMIYKRFERFWHWSQAIMVIGMMITGFEIHGTYTLMGFGKAVYWHTQIAYALLTLWAFAIVWQFTTGEWRQYLPGLRNVDAMVRYYAYGIFAGKPHPCPKRPDAKHNPLQRMTYLSLAAVLLPFQMVTGLLYYLYNSWTDMGITGLSLGVVAMAHLLGAFAILIFLIVHVYMTTTGHTIFAHVKAMFTGREEVEDVCDVAEWEKKNPA